MVIVVEYAVISLKLFHIAIHVRTIITMCTKEKNWLINTYRDHDLDGTGSLVPAIANSSVILIMVNVKRPSS